MTKEDEFGKIKIRINSEYLTGSKSGLTGIDYWIRPDDFKKLEITPRKGHLIEVLKEFNSVDNSALS